FVSASDIAGIAAAKRAGPARATASTGGRLVSLVDGKEYSIPSAGVSFGREAGSDIVVAQPEVSRRHASIAPGDGGYGLTDHSPTPGATGRACHCSGGNRTTGARTRAADSTGEPREIGQTRTEKGGSISRTGEEWRSAAIGVDYHHHHRGRCRLLRRTG